MNNVVPIGTPSKKKRKQSRCGGLVTTVGLLLALIIYCLLIEQYGFPFLELDDDEQVIEAAQ